MKKSNSDINREKDNTCKKQRSTRDLIIESIVEEDNNNHQKDAALKKFFTFVEVQTISTLPSPPEEASDIVVEIREEQIEETPTADG